MVKDNHQGTNYPAGNYMFNVNNINIRTRCERDSEILEVNPLQVKVMLQILYIYIYIYIYTYSHIYIYI